jgi:4,5-dihydroxyphthalate decarboxylase
MNKLTLSFASAYNERVEPLMDGTVEPEGVKLLPTYSDPPVTFWRQLKFQDFDVSEMSLSSFLIARSQGFDYLALPVFPSRRLFQTELSYHEDSGINEPGDLVGKRLGVAEYQQTAALWTRGILEHDFGVSQYQVHWFMERTEELSHGGATGFKPPEGISFQRIPPDKSLASMLVEHELDAAAVQRTMQRQGTNIIERSQRIRGSGDWSKVRPLFPDRQAEAARFYKAHGFLPANHTYIVRGELVRQYPWLPLNLYFAFVKAKEVWNEQLTERIPSALFFGREYLAQTKQLIGDDPFAYGLKANQDMLNTLVGYSHEQGLTPRKLAFEELFAEPTLGL